MVYSDQVIRSLLLPFKDTPFMQDKEFVQLLIRVCRLFLVQKVTPI